jgi:hypothetical protein
MVGHVTLQNVGHLPARKLYWLVKLNRGGSDWRPPKIKSKELEGESVLPIGAEWPQGSKGLPDPQDRSPYQDETGLYLYVWGRGAREGKCCQRLANSKISADFAVCLLPEKTVAV